MSSSPETLIFVYGTLKQGAVNHCEMEGARFLGNAVTQPGWRLLLVADYPGLVEKPGDAGTVSGELFAVTPSLLKHLDAFEGLDEGLYRRESITLQGLHAHLSVQTYVYARPAEGCRDLEGFWPLAGS